MISFKYIEQRPLSFRFISVVVGVTFLLTSVVPPRSSYAQVTPRTILNLPVPGTMVNLTPWYTPVMVKGLRLNPENPLQFDFIVNTGDSDLEGEALRGEGTKLIKYFMAALTVPEDELWVNLSPYEKDRVITDAFGVTEMGRDLLAQDYMLKQLTASLVNPEEELGKEFWRRVQKKAYEEYGTIDIPMNTFNKVWIVPERAVVYEYEGTAYVVERRLKVMMETDYMALQANGHRVGAVREPPLQSGIASEIIREVIIPEIEKEVNEGETFAQLRQIYNSMILATWYKLNLKQTLLGQVYADKNKTAGIDVVDKGIKEKIYRQYLEAFEKGVYDFIKEDYDPATNDIIARKYFSGGFDPAMLDKTVSRGQKKITDLALLSPQEFGLIRGSLLKTEGKDLAVTVDMMEITTESSGYAQSFAEQPAVLADGAMLSYRAEEILKRFGMILGSLVIGGLILWGVDRFGESVNSDLFKAQENAAKEHRVRIDSNGETVDYQQLLFMAKWDLRKGDVITIQILSEKREITLDKIVMLNPLTVVDSQGKTHIILHDLKAIYIIRGGVVADQADQAMRANPSFGEFLKGGGYWIISGALVAGGIGALVNIQARQHRNETAQRIGGYERLIDSTGVAGAMSHGDFLRVVQPEDTVTVTFKDGKEERFVFSAVTDQSVPYTRAKDTSGEERFMPTNGTYSVSRPKGGAIDQAMISLPRILVLMGLSVVLIAVDGVISLSEFLDFSGAQLYARQVAQNPKTVKAQSNLASGKLLTIAGLPFDQTETFMVTGQGDTLVFSITKSSVDSAGGAVQYRIDGPFGEKGENPIVVEKDDITSIMTPNDEIRLDLTTEDISIKNRKEGDITISFDAPNSVDLGASKVNTLRKGDKVVIKSVDMIYQGTIGAMKRWRATLNPADYINMTIFDEKGNVIVIIDNIDPYSTFKEAGFVAVQFGKDQGMTTDEGFDVDAILLKKQAEKHESRMVGVGGSATKDRASLGKERETLFDRMVNHFAIIYLMSFIGLGTHYYFKMIPRYNENFSKPAYRQAFQRQLDSTGVSLDYEKFIGHARTGNLDGRTVTITFFEGKKTKIIFDRFEDGWDWRPDIVLGRNGKRVEISPLEKFFVHPTSEGGPAAQADQAMMEKIGEFLEEYPITKFLGALGIGIVAVALIFNFTAPTMNERYQARLAKDQAFEVALTRDGKVTLPFEEFINSSVQYEDTVRIQFANGQRREIVFQRFEGSRTMVGRGPGNRIDIAPGDTFTVVRPDQAMTVEDGLNLPFAGYYKPQDAAMLSFKQVWQILLVGFCVACGSDNSTEKIKNAKYSYQISTAQLEKVSLFTQAVKKQDRNYWDYLSDVRGHMQVLTSIGGADAIIALRNVLNDVSYYGVIREYAAEFLVKMIKEDKVPEEVAGIIFSDLKKALSSDDVFARRGAAVSLGQLGQKQATPDLEKTLADENDFDVRHAIRFALAQLRGEKTMRESEMTEMEGIIYRLMSQDGEMSDIIDSMQFFQRGRDKINIFIFKSPKKAIDYLNDLRYGTDSEREFASKLLPVVKRLDKAMAAKPDQAMGNFLKKIVLPFLFILGSNGVWIYLGYIQVRDARQSVMKVIEGSPLPYKNFIDAFNQKMIKEGKKIEIQHLDGVKITVTFKEFKDFSPLPQTIVDKNNGEEYGIGSKDVFTILSDSTDYAMTVTTDEAMASQGQVIIQATSVGKVDSLLNKDGNGQLSPTGELALDGQLYTVKTNDSLTIKLKRNFPGLIGGQEPSFTVSNEPNIGMVVKVKVNTPGVPKYVIHTLLEEQIVYFGLPAEGSEDGEPVVRFADNPAHLKYIYLAFRRINGQDILVKNYLDTTIETDVDGPQTRFRHRVNVLITMLLLSTVTTYLVSQIGVHAALSQQYAARVRRTTGRRDDSVVVDYDEFVALARTGLVSPGTNIEIKHLDGKIEEINFYALDLPPQPKYALDKDFQPHHVAKEDSFKIFNGPYGLGKTFYDDAMTAEKRSADRAMLGEDVKDFLRTFVPLSLLAFGGLSLWIYARHMNGIAAKESLKITILETIEGVPLPYKNFVAAVKLKMIKEGQKIEIHRLNGRVIVVAFEKFDSKSQEIVDYNNGERYPIGTKDVFIVPGDSTAGLNDRAMTTAMPYFSADFQKKLGQGLWGGLFALRLNKRLDRLAHGRDFKERKEKIGEALEALITTLEEFEGEWWLDEKESWILDDVNANMTRVNRARILGLLNRSRSYNEAWKNIHIAREIARVIHNQIMDNRIKEIPVKSGGHQVPDEIPIQLDLFGLMAEVRKWMERDISVEVVVQELVYERTEGATSILTLFKGDPVDIYIPVLKVRPVILTQNAVINLAAASVIDIAIAIYLRLNDKFRDQMDNILLEINALEKGDALLNGVKRILDVDVLDPSVASQYAPEVVAKKSKYFRQEVLTRAEEAADALQTLQNILQAPVTIHALNITRQSEEVVLVAPSLAEIYPSDLAMVSLRVWAAMAGFSFVFISGINRDSLFALPGSALVFVQDKTPARSKGQVVETKLAQDQSYALFGLRLDRKESFSIVTPTDTLTFSVTKVKSDSLGGAARYQVQGPLGQGDTSRVVAENDIIEVTTDDGTLIELLLARNGIIITRLSKKGITVLFELPIISLDVKKVKDLSVGMKVAITKRLPSGIIRTDLGKIVKISPSTSFNYYGKLQSFDLFIQTGDDGDHQFTIIGNLQGDSPLPEGMVVLADEAMTVKQALLLLGFAGAVATPLIIHKINDLQLEQTIRGANYNYSVPQEQAERVQRLLQSVKREMEERENYWDYRSAVQRGLDTLVTIGGPETIIGLWDIIHDSGVMEMTRRKAIGSLVGLAIERPMPQEVLAILVDDLIKEGLSNDSFLLRWAAAEGLGNFGKKDGIISTEQRAQAIFALKDVLTNETDFDVRQVIRDALKKLGEPLAEETMTEVEAILRGLIKKDREMSSLVDGILFFGSQRHVVNIAISRSPEDAISYLESLLDSSSDYEREFATRLLPEIRKYVQFKAAVGLDPQAIRDMAKVFIERHWQSQREEAVQRLAQAGRESKDKETFVKILMEIYGEIEPGRVDSRGYMVQALEGIGGQEAVHAIQGILLSNEQNFIRLAAAQALINIGDDVTVVGYFIQDLNRLMPLDDINNILIESLEIQYLKEKKAVEAISILLQYLENRPHFFEAADALVSIGGETIVPSLSRILKNNANVLAQSQAARLLGRIGGPKATQVLVEWILSEGRDYFKYFKIFMDLSKGTSMEEAITLFTQGGAPATTILLGAVRSALENTPQSAIPLLEEALQKEEDTLMKAFIQEILAGMKKSDKAMVGSFEELGKIITTALKVIDEFDGEEIIEIMGQGIESQLILKAWDIMAEQKILDPSTKTQLRLAIVDAIENSTDSVDLDNPLTFLNILRINLKRVNLDKVPERFLPAEEQELSNMGKSDQIVKMLEEILILMIHWPLAQVLVSQLADEKEAVIGRNMNMKRVNGIVTVLKAKYSELKDVWPADVDAAQLPPGGIDLNPALLDLQIKRDGKGIPLPLNQQPLKSFTIEGFLPVIIQIIPINMPVFLGLVDEGEEENEYSYQDTLGPMETKKRSKATEIGEIGDV